MGRPFLKTEDQLKFGLQYKRPTPAFQPIAGQQDLLQPNTTSPANSLQ
jgi:hypothetical protein